MTTSPESQTPKSSLRLDTVSNPECTVVLVRGEIDASTAPQLQAVVEGLTEETSDLAFDLAELRFMDSTGLGVIASTIKRLEPFGAKLVLRNVPQMAERLLDISDLKRFVIIADD